MKKIERQNYDVSRKEYEVLSRQYIFWKKTRKIDTNMTTHNDDWYHYKYYSSMENAEQAVKDLRRNFYASSQIGDRIFCYRYKAVRRWEYRDREEKLKRILCIT